MVTILRDTNYNVPVAKRQENTQQTETRRYKLLLITLYKEKYLFVDFSIVPSKKIFSFISLYPAPHYFSLDFV